MKVLFFGVLADICGVKELIVNQATDIDTLQNDLFTKYPLLKNYNFQLVLNAQKVTSNMTLNLNDEVAFLPPFAGG